jgi:hypothetical protein
MFPIEIGVKGQWWILEKKNFLRTIEYHPFHLESSCHTFELQMEISSLLILGSKGQGSSVMVMKEEI